MGDYQAMRQWVSLILVFEIVVVITSIRVGSRQRESVRDPSSLLRMAVSLLRRKGMVPTINA